MFCRSTTVVACCVYINCITFAGVCLCVCSSITPYPHCLLGGKVSVRFRVHIVSLRATCQCQLGERVMDDVQLLYQRIETGAPPDDDA